MQITMDAINPQRINAQWGRQLIMATVIALCVHGLMFVGFAVMRSNMRNLAQPDYAGHLPIELWQTPSAPVARHMDQSSHGRPAGVPVITSDEGAETSLATGVKSDNEALETDSTAQVRLAQAMQAHARCVSLQTAGKPVPSACHMSDLASQTPLGQKPDEGLQAAVAQKDYVLQYKATPGNSAYWKRVAGTTIDSDLRHCSAQPGAYSNAKDQRVMRCWAPDPKNGYGVH